MSALPAPASAGGGEPPSITRLVWSWRERAAELRSWGAAGNAVTLERAADELEAALRAEAEQLLPLEWAAQLSGFHPDSLRRMVRERKIPVVTRGRRLYFRAGDLPRKPASIDGLHVVRYDAVADARRVADRRSHED